MCQVISIFQNEETIRLFVISKLGRIRRNQRKHEGKAWNNERMVSGSTEKTNS